MSTATAGLLIALASGCSDSPGAPDAIAPASPFVVSAPHTAANTGSAASASVSSDSRFVYVALPAGAIRPRH